MDIDHKSSTFPTKSLECKNREHILRVRELRLIKKGRNPNLKNFLSLTINVKNESCQGKEKKKN